MKNRNKKTIYIILIVILAVLVGYFVLKDLSKKANNNQANKGNLYYETNTGLKYADYSAATKEDNGQSSNSQDEKSIESEDIKEDIKGIEEFSPRDEVENEDTLGIRFPYDIAEDDITFQMVGSYTGLNIEDGQDSEADNVIAFVITNNSSQVLQYAQIELSINGTEDKVLLKVSSLPSGKSTLAIDVNNNQYSENNYYVISNKLIALMESPSFMNDKLKVRGEDGKIIVENTSDEDIAQVYVYYKYGYDDLYLGGITYRCLFKNVAAGETLENAANHFNPETSVIMMITGE